MCNEKICYKFAYGAVTVDPPLLIKSYSRQPITNACYIVVKAGYALGIDVHHSSRLSGQIIRNPMHVHNTDISLKNIPYISWEDMTHNMKTSNNNAWDAFLKGRLE